ncbi:MAG: class I SAM-dependent methyltransferase [Gammaproteobacteria bacterium]|nr:class I SAM-dependent methyltransferase [Gammaproteobacteria bacterium]
MRLNDAQLQRASTDVSRAKYILARIFRHYTGAVAVRFWDGETLALGRADPVATIVLNSAKPLRNLALLRDPLDLIEAYFIGDMDIEGDVYALLEQRSHLPSLRFSWRDRAALFFATLFSDSEVQPAIDLKNNSFRWSKPVLALLQAKPSRAYNREAIAFHYDASNDFYRLWLDEQMIYSCAYFNDPNDSLDQAQRNKLEHICRKLRLKSGERLLDIGCGWGALICWAAMQHGVRAHGITLSRQQYEHTQAKIRTLGLTQQVTVELLDYRDLPPMVMYDKVSSIGMFEHVGLKNLPAYFKAVNRVLKPGGLFLNHGITDNEENRRVTPETKFIKRYVFPDGELDNVSNVQNVMERSGWEMLDVEALRPHYALTLRRWVNRLEARRKEALAHVSEATYRVWRLYMAGCVTQFEKGTIGVYQMLAAKKHPGLLDIPLTRADIYRSG